VSSLALRQSAGDGDGAEQTWPRRRPGLASLRVEAGGPEEQLAGTLEMLQEHLHHLQAELLRCEVTLQLAQRAAAGLRRQSAAEDEGAGRVRVVTAYGAAELHVAGRRMHLTRAEWQLLRVLADNPGVTLTRSELATRAWGAGYGNRCGEVEVYVCRLRRKLGDGPGRPTRMIDTVRGVGYRFSSAPGLLDCSQSEASAGADA
jgi:DNA-binding winged helix-turn-helix (wHTH) protein